MAADAADERSGRMAHPAEVKTGRMVGADDHRRIVAHVYPAVSLVVVAAAFAATGDSTLVLFTLAAGYGLLNAGSVLPDVDSPASKPRRALGWLLSATLVVGLVRSTLGAAGWLNGAVVADHLPPESGMLVLVVLLLLWVGVSSRHRSLTHSFAWAGGVAVAVGALGYSIVRYGGHRPALTVGAAVGAYSFVGVYSHMALDDEWKLVHAADDRTFTAYRRYLNRAERLYLVTSLVVVCVGVALVDSSLVLVAVLVTGYGALVVGLTLPEIERKRSRPRRTFDRVVSGVLLCALVQQVVRAATPLSAAVRVPTGAWPAFYLLVFVLWVGRNARQGAVAGWVGRHVRSDSVTHSGAWMASVAASALLCAFAVTRGLPTVESVVVAGGVGGYLSVGLYHHRRVDGSE